MATDSEFNPFRPGGELSKEVDDILKNSTILRDTVIINDPALRKPNGVTAGSTCANAHEISNVSAVGENPSSLVLPHQKISDKVDSNSQSHNPITCEVTAQHIPPLQCSEAFQQGQVERVTLKTKKRRFLCCATV